MQEAICQGKDRLRPYVVSTAFLEHREEEGRGLHPFLFHRIQYAALSKPLGTRRVHGFCIRWPTRGSQVVEPPSVPLNGALGQ